MAHCIKEHRRHRGKEWLTVEESVQLTNALLNNRGRVDCAVVDCLTLWISNLILLRDEEYAAEKVEQLIEKLPQLDFDIIFVTNEVGWAVVPDNPLARKFRDLSGTTNQRIAHAADEVILMVAGIPMIVKQGGTMLLETTLEKIRFLDPSIEAKAQSRLDSLTKPQGSLGRL